MLPDGLNVGYHVGAVLRGVDVEGEPVAAFAFNFLDEVGGPGRVARGSDYVVAMGLGEAGEAETESGRAPGYEPCQGPVGHVESGTSRHLGVLSFLIFLFSFVRCGGFFVMTRLEVLVWRSSSKVSGIYVAD